MPRLLPFLVLLALLVAPFGRIGVAEAASSPHHGAPMVMAGHCEEMPSQDDAKPGKAIDCMIACAAIAPAAAPFVRAQEVTVDAPAPLPLFSFTGIQPEAEPPPPRA